MDKKLIDSQFKQPPELGYGIAFTQGLQVSHE
jgi:hypothetical protein